jgi:Anti-sigma-D factor RsdA to sigma factor binding region
MPDFSRWGGNGGDPSLNAIARTDSFFDALASEQPVYATDPADAELANLMAGWRDEVRRPPARVAAVRDAEIVLQRALASRQRTRMSMAVMGSVAAALLCLGGFGAVVYGAAPGDALYGLRVSLFGEQQVTRDDKVALAAQTEMQQVQQLIQQGNWDAAQDKLSTITSTVQTVEDPQRQQELQQQLNDLTVKVETRDPAATAAQSAPLNPEAPAGPGISLPVEMPSLPNLPVPPSLPGQLPVPLPDISLPQLPIPQLPLPGPGVPPDISLPPIQLPKPLPDGPKPLPDGPKPLPDGPKPLPDGPKPLPKPGSDDDSTPKPGQEQPKPLPAPDEPEAAPKPVEPPKSLEIPKPVELPKPVEPQAPAPAPAPVQEAPPAAVVPVIPPAPKAPPALAPQQDAPKQVEPSTTVFPIPAEKPKHGG